MTPIELLTKEFNSNKKALRKSNLSWFIGVLDFKTHKKHRDNLQPLIIQYKQAIKKLNA